MRTEPKRLVLIVPAFPKLTETFIVSKFLGLLARGWDVHIVCSKSEKAEWKQFSALEADPTLRTYVHVSWPHRNKLLAALLLGPALVRASFSSPKTTWAYLREGIRKLGLDAFRRFYLDLELICLAPDCIHFEFGALAVEKTYLKDLLNTRLSVSFRGYDLNFTGLDKKNYYATVWQEADACHFLGKDLWQRAQQRGCPPTMPHALIPPAIDLVNFPFAEKQIAESIGTAERPVRILSVGRLEWKKGYEFGLQAVKLLQDEGFGISYRIIGSGQAQDSLYFARYQLNLEDSVAFCGALSHAEVLEALTWADVFLHPSLSEGFCNAVLEAQTMGVPVVCTDAGDLPNNIADGVSGFIVFRRDVRAMASKLMALVQDAKLRDRMGTAGRERVEAFFQIETQLDAWEQFYEVLL